MSCLHILNKPLNDNTRSLLIHALDSKDALLLIEDAVYEFKKQNLSFLSQIQQPVYFLKNDCIARGLCCDNHQEDPNHSLSINEEQLLENYEDLVTLLLSYERNITWTL